MAAFVTVEWAPASDPNDITPTWVDITSIVQEVTVTGGRSGVFDLYGPRTATIVCRNGTRSPAVAPTFDVQGFYRWRQIRVTGSGIQIFVGYILSVEHDQTNSPFHGEATLSCADAMVMLGQGEFAPTDVGGNEVNGFENVFTVDEAVDFAAALVGLDPSLVSTIAPSTAFFKLPDEPSGQVLAWLQSVMEAEAAGPVQIDASTGSLYTSGRYLPFTVAAQAVDLTFSDTPTGDDVKYLRENLVFAATDSDYYNRAVTKSAYHDPTFTVSNIPSGYPAETISRTDLPFVYSSWAEANAGLYTKLYSQTVTYPRSLSVFLSSRSDDAAWALFLCLYTITFGAFHIVVEHTPAGDTQQTYHVTIESVNHHITPELWTCELGFASLDRWIAAYPDGGSIATLFLVGSSLLGGGDIIAP